MAIIQRKTERCHSRRSANKTKKLCLHVDVDVKKLKRSLRRRRKNIYVFSLAIQFSCHVQTNGQSVERRLPPEVAEKVRRKEGTVINRLYDSIFRFLQHFCLVNNWKKEAKKTINLAMSMYQCPYELLL